MSRPARLLFASFLLSLASAAAFGQTGAGPRWQAAQQEAEQRMQRGDATGAAAAARRAVELARAGGDAALEDLAVSLRSFGHILLRLGQRPQAEAQFRESVAVFERAAPASAELAESLCVLGDLLHDNQRLAEAVPLYTRGLALFQRAGVAESAHVLLHLNALGVVYYDLGDFVRSEATLRQALVLREKVLGTETADVASSLNNLATTLKALGRAPEAEAMHKRALALREKLHGPENFKVAESLNNLAALYHEQGRTAQAEPLFTRSLAILEKILPPGDRRIAWSMNNLASVHGELKRPQEAETLHRRALAILEQAVGPEHPDVAIAVNNLAAHQQDQGRHAEAEPLFRRALAIREKVLGPDHPLVGDSLDSLGGVFDSQDRFAEAEPFFLRALAIHEKALGPDHPELARTLHHVASVARSQRRHAEALPLFRRLTRIYEQRIVAGGADDAARLESAANQVGFRQHLGLLTRNPLQEPPAQVTDEALQVVQLMQASGTGAAIAKMAARFARGDDALAQLVKRKQDALETRSRAEGELVAASAQPPRQRQPAVEQRLRELAALQSREIAALDAELGRRFPEYQELTRPQPRRGRTGGRQRAAAAPAAAGRGAAPAGTRRPAVTRDCVARCRTRAPLPRIPGAHPAAAAAGAGSPGAPGR